MNTATIFKEELNNPAIWDTIIRELELPRDTDELILKAVCHVTEEQRKGTREKGARKSLAKKGCADRGSTVQVVIAGGAVQSIVKPRGISLEIRDYDIDEDDAENSENCEQDEEGDWYQLISWGKNEIEGQY